MKSIRSSIARFGAARTNGTAGSDFEFRGVVPSQRDWDRLMKSIDQKADTANRLIDQVLQQQARRK
jgi:hypothetical protein